MESYIDAAGNELIAARDQIVHEIARVFRIPAHLLLSKDGSNVYSNIEIMDLLL